MVFITCNYKIKIESRLWEQSGFPTEFVLWCQSWMEWCSPASLDIALFSEPGGQVWSQIFHNEFTNINFGIQPPKSKIRGIKSESELCWNSSGNEERSPCTWAGQMSLEQQWEQWGFLISHITEGRIKIILEWLLTYCGPSFLKQKFNLLQESMTKWWLIKTGPSI